MSEPADVPRLLGDLIARHSARLTDADARLLDVLMRDPFRAAMDNGKEVSSRAGVHPASAVRLARRLGFEGYPEFRSFLQSGLVAEANRDLDNPAARIAARLARAEQGGVLASILDSEIAALQQARNTLAETDIRGFSEALRDARRIFVYGLGHAATLSALLALRLQRSGYEAADLAAMTHMAEALNAMTSDDVLWLLSFRDPHPVVRALRGIAAERRATVLLLSDVNGLRIEPAPHRVITVSRGGVGQSQSLVVPMTVANAIILDLAAIDEGRSVRALDEFRRFRAALPMTVPR